MALNVKVGLIGVLDMLKFKNMAKVREAAIEAAPAKEITANYPINNNAKALHPDSQKLLIKEIIDHPGADAKSFVLASEDGKPVAYFQAGQYLSVSMEIENSHITRPFSISSSPKWTEEGKYAITIKRNSDGFASGYAMDHWKVGDKLTVSGAQGHFNYESLRDAKNVVALAGGSGITPFLSMAYAIRDGIEDFNLTILFGSRNEEGILFKDELDAIAKACDKVKIVHILSDEEKEGYEHGFITAELIKKYAVAPYSVFICGPEAMYRFAADEVKKLDIDPRLIRRELLGATKKVWEEPGYPVDCKGKTFQLKVIQGAATYDISASADESVLVAIERAGIAAPSRCRSGECGWCRSRLVDGKVFIPKETDGRRWQDTKSGWMHPCATFPISDLTVEVPGTYQK